VKGKRENLYGEANRMLEKGENRRGRGFRGVLSKEFRLGFGEEKGAVATGATAIEREKLKNGKLKKREKNHRGLKGVRWFQEGMSRHEVLSRVAAHKERMRWSCRGRSLTKTQQGGRHPDEKEISEKAQGGLQGGGWRTSKGEGKQWEAETREMSGRSRKRKRLGRQ